jgi:hypothetical protein
MYYVCIYYTHVYTHKHTHAHARTHVLDWVHHILMSMVDTDTYTRICMYRHIRVTCSYIKLYIIPICIHNMCVYIYTHTYIHDTSWKHTHIHTNINLHTSIYTYESTYLYNTHTRIHHKHISTLICIHIYSHIRMNTYSHHTHTHMYKSTQIQTHVFTHTCTYARLPQSLANGCT